MGEVEHPAVARVAATLDAADAVDAVRTLGAGVTAQDLTSFLLAVSRVRAGRVSAADLMRRFAQDRFVQVGAVHGGRLLQLEAAAIDSVSPPFEPVVLAPLVPLGTHAVLGGVRQDNVVTTTRSTEVAADPTVSLALVAAQRRLGLLAEDARSPHDVRLAAVARVTRAQRFDGPLSFAHFSLLGLVTAGRDTGGRRFEAAAFVEHIEALARATRACGGESVRAELTDFSGSMSGELRVALRQLELAGIEAREAPGRTAGRGYYPNLCFKLAILAGDEPVEVGDGGIVEWTQQLVGSRKERLMTSGLGLERLAALRL